jgi:hypothetical protein
VIRLYFYECPVTDVVGAIVDALGTAGEVAGGVAAGAGAADAAGAFGGVADATAGIGADVGAETAGAASLDAGLGASTDAGLTSGLAGLNIPTDAATGVAGGADATTAALPSAGAGGGGAGAPALGAGGSSATLDPLTVTAQSTAGAGGAGAGLGSAGIQNALGPIAGAGLLAGAGAGGGGSGVAGTQGSPAGLSQGPLSANADVSPGAETDIGQTLDTGLGGGGNTFLSATGAADVNPLSPDISQSLGIDPSGGFNAGGASDFDAANAGINPADTGINPATGAPDAGFSGGSNPMSGLGSWLSNPKNAATAGLLGLSLKSALTQPKLPGASGTANAAATQAVQGANSVIQSGGTATPEWASQKSSIDATINQQIQQQTEAIMQAAASSGEGNQNSGIVQQQIAQMTQNANVQRQQLYAQAQQQNVQAALSELSGGDATLTAIGNTQLQQSEQAQQLAAQTAELALMLQSGTGGIKIPGLSTGSTAVPGS